MRVSLASGGTKGNGDSPGQDSSGRLNYNGLQYSWWILRVSILTACHRCQNRLVHKLPTHRWRAHSGHIKLQTWSTRMGSEHSDRTCTTIRSHCLRFYNGKRLHRLPTNSNWMDSSHLCLQESNFWWTFWNIPFKISRTIWETYSWVIWSFCKWDNSNGKDQRMPAQIRHQNCRGQWCTTVWTLKGVDSWF